MIVLFSQSNSDDDDDDGETSDSMNDDEINKNNEQQQEEQQLSIINSQSNEFQKAAQTAENEYLLAMLQQSLDFQSIKKNEGSEMACEEFRRRIQISDEEEAAEAAAAAAAAAVDATQQQSEVDREESDDDDDSSRDAMDKMWFVKQQKMGMESDSGGDIIERMREVDDNNNVGDDAWQ